MGCSTSDGAKAGTIVFIDGEGLTAPLAYPGLIVDAGFAPVCRTALVRAEVVLCCDFLGHKRLAAIGAGVLHALSWGLSLGVLAMPLAAFR